MPDNPKRGRASARGAAFAFVLRLVLVVALAAGSVWSGAAAVAPSSTSMSHMAMAPAAHLGGAAVHETAGHAAMHGDCSSGAKRHSAAQSCAWQCLSHCGIPEAMAMPLAERVIPGTRVCEGAVSWRSFSTEPVVPPPRLPS